MRGNSPIVYLDYDRISDILIYFSKEITLKFNVSLANKDKDGRRRFFHREAIYQSKYSNVGEVISIKRELNFYFSIDDSRNFQNGVMIGVQDVFLFKILADKNIIPWYIGNRSIFSTSPDDGSIILTGKYKPQQFVLSDYKYLEFLPIVIRYEDGKTSFGVRMNINNPENYVDMDLNKFLAFYHIITNTDMYVAACSMVNYVKTQPYGINTFSFESNNNTSHASNFFDKI